MVEDMDSLDDKLFNNAFKRNPSSEDGRKRITFADEDDPLADLLADKNDFPSSQRNPIAVRDKRNIIDNLFDTKVSNESISSSKPGSEKLKVLDDKSKKLSLMQDLFGDTLHTSPSKELSVSKKSTQPEQEASVTEVSRTQSQFSTYAPTAFGTREPRRGKRSSEIINDPLGLLSLSTASSQTQQSTIERNAVSADSIRRKSETKEYLPEWLEIKKSSEDKSADHTQDRATPIEELYSRHRRSSSDKVVQEAANIQQKEESRLSESLPQEKEKLMKSLDNQKEINEQEKWKVSVEEDQRNHRTNTVVVSSSNVSRNSVDDNLIHKETGYKNVIQKLELEKSHMSVTIHSLNEKYENEIMILDESYKRQIGFLQERTDTLEKRMQQELEYLETDYEAKIEKLKNERIQIETFYKEEIQNLKKEHAQFIEEIYERHSQNIRLLQKEHFDTIENLLKMREVENLAMTTIATHKTDLQNLLQKAGFIIEDIKNVQEKTDQRDGQSVKLREHHLKNQEEDVQIRYADVKKQQELLVQERDRMMKIADKLDSHVAQLVLELEKKSTMLNEALETLKRREQFLSHEREIFEEKVQWERNHLQALKESWFNEQEKELRALTKEKEMIAAKKRQYEVLRTIKANSDSTTKIELAAAMKAAQDATVLANQERLKWQEKIKDLEMQRQNLQEKEYRLLARAQDLENFTQVAYAKNEEAVKALEEARHIENEHKATFDAHFGVLAHRQNTTAQKLNMASERLALRTAQVEKLEKSTNMNIPYNYEQTNTEKQALSSQQNAFQLTTHFTEIVDPQLVMLKLNLDDQLDNVQYMTAMKF
ncbi:trichohyalin-like [Odontomachus brunneus]|uniref:trichohyalin-like n=1 Tax=Odontomachus brunneus TaxID=486640 RepID=UPI0013F1D6B4|nr:trichohyalin-like [Odontomachus brunneus]XP_032676939.1 trichohyalin-like [Odontomachus brunneus]